QALQLRVLLRLISQSFSGNVQRCLAALSLLARLFELSHHRARPSFPPRPLLPPFPHVYYIPVAVALTAWVDLKLSLPRRTRLWLIDARLLTAFVGKAHMRNRSQLRDK